MSGLAAAIGLDVNAWGLPVILAGNLVFILGFFLAVILVVNLNSNLGGPAASLLRGA